MWPFKPKVYVPKIGDTVTDGIVTGKLIRDCVICDGNKQYLVQTIKPSDQILMISLETCLKCDRKDCGIAHL